MQAFRPICSSCGDVLGAGPHLVGDAATAFEDSVQSAEDSTATDFLDSIHLPSVDGELMEETVVRPSLAILFRMAVGPGADYYGPRFLEWERTGRSFPSWNWAPLVAPGVWAFYRRLWWPGVAFTAWPLVALAVFGLALPHLGLSDDVAIAVAATLTWFLPGIVAALVGNTLVYRRARRLVRDAETLTRRPDKAARWLSRRTVIAPMPAVASAAAIFITAGAAVPILDSAYYDQVVRSRIAERLVAIQPLQRQLEEWFISRLPSDAPPLVTLLARAGAESAGAVSVSLDNGRVRLALDPLAPELSGRSILLAPAIDRRRQVRWICIPVDVPAKYLPEECRQG